MTAGRSDRLGRGRHGYARLLTELFAAVFAGPIMSSTKAAMMLVARPDSVVLLTQSLLDFDHPALTFRMHPSSGAIVAEHPPVGPDLLTLDLYDEDVVKIEAELPQFGDHHHGEFVRSQCRFLHLNHLGKCGTHYASAAAHRQLLCQCVVRDEDGR